jgi:hypothetical protein
MSQKNPTGPKIIEGWQELKDFLLSISSNTFPVSITLHQQNGTIDYTKLKKISIILETENGSISLHEEEFKKMEIKQLV